MPFEKGNKYARRGNGAGKGNGWGGPAKGASTTRIGAGPEGDAIRARAHDKALRAAKEERNQMLKDHLFLLALCAERQETQVAAATAWLDRDEGKPIARSVTTTVDDVSQLSDLELAAEIARLKRELGEVDARGGEAKAGEPPGGVSPVH